MGMKKRSQRNQRHCCGLESRFLPHNIGFVAKYHFANFVSKGKTFIAGDVTDFGGKMTQQIFPGLLYFSVE